MTASPCVRRAARPCFTENEWTQRQRNRRSGMVRSCERTAMKSFLPVMLFAAALSSSAATLPGFRVEKLGVTDAGFISGLAVDSKNNIYYTTTAGDVVRFDNGRNT